MRIDYRRDLEADARRPTIATEFLNVTEPKLRPVATFSDSMARLLSTTRFHKSCLHNAFLEIIAKSLEHIRHLVPV